VGLIVGVVVVVAGVKKLLREREILLEEKKMLLRAKGMLLTSLPDEGPATCQIPSNSLARGLLISLSEYILL
jgi:hypothetical protein